MSARRLAVSHRTDPLERLSPSWTGAKPELPPHPATVAQPRPAFAGSLGRPPHPATVAQPRPALAGSLERSPHPATVAQPRPAFAGPLERPPHPATVTASRPPHAAAIVQRAELPAAEAAKLDLAAKKGDGGSTRIVENNTRFGLEVEPGAHFKVKGSYAGKVPKLINKTLAWREYLELIIDDYREDGSVQIELRTAPLNRKLLKDCPALKKSLTGTLGSLPSEAFAGPGSKPLSYNDTAAALTSAKWHPEPALAQIAAGLTRLDWTRLSWKPLQHFTFSIPLETFPTLGEKDKNLLLPGSGRVRSIVDLMLYFYQKILNVTEKGTIVVTTTGRNQEAPNPKTALDTLLGLMDPDLARQTLKAMGTLPTHVQLSNDPPVKLGEIVFFKDGDLPKFPTANPQDGRGYLSGEEKLKPPMFDEKRKDVRVLVEHRANDLVKAVNDAIAGRTSGLAPYLTAFDNLDKKSGKGEAFGRWFK